MENNNDSNEKEISGNSIEFGLRMKLPLENIGLYFLAQRGNLLYEKLQKMSSTKKSSFDNEVQKLFTTVTNEIEKMIHSSKHLPLIKEGDIEKMIHSSKPPFALEENNIKWRIFDAEREYRLYYYLSKLNAQTIADFDSQLDNIGLKLSDPYARLMKLVQKLSQMESRLYKLEYIMALTNSDQGESREDSYKKPIKKTKEKTYSKTYLILFPIVATMYFIRGFKSGDWWDLALGCVLLVTTILNIYFQHSSRFFIVSYISLGIFSLLLGGQSIVESPEHNIKGPLFIFVGIAIIVGISYLYKKNRKF
jgi:hypothetical protein